MSIGIGGRRSMSPTESAMTKPEASRRAFHRASLTALLAAAAGTSFVGTAAAQQRTPLNGSARRDVIKQELPGEPPRDLMLVEVTYAPGAGSSAHQHANGVMAFVVSGAVASKVNDGPEQTFRAGDAWWEPPGAIHRVSRNASPKEPAMLLAIYIAPRGTTAADLIKPI
jgi:quercetin dioxygenase-like cupin family protein